MAKSKPETYDPPSPLETPEAAPERKKANRRPMSDVMRIVLKIDRLIHSLPTELERQRAFKMFATMTEAEAPLFPAKVPQL